MRNAKAGQLDQATHATQLATTALLSLKFMADIEGVNLCFYHRLP